MGPSLNDSGKRHSPFRKALFPPTFWCQCLPSHNVRIIKYSSTWDRNCYTTIVVFLNMPLDMTGPLISSTSTGDSSWDNGHYLVVLCVHGTSSLVNTSHSLRTINIWESLFNSFSLHYLPGCIDSTCEMFAVKWWTIPAIRRSKKCFPNYVLLLRLMWDTGQGNEVDLSW